MGHRNTQFTGNMTETETDRQGQTHLHPEPGLFYGSLPNYPHPSLHSMVPPPVNQSNFNFHHMPERHGSALFYGTPHLSPAQHLDLAIGPSSAHYNPYLPVPSGIRDFPLQVTHDQLSLSSTQRVGVPTDTYTIGASFKRENASAGPSSSFVTADSDVTMLDTASFLPSDYGGNDPRSMVESGSQRSGRNVARVIGHEPILVRNNGRLIRGNFAAPPGNPWLDMQYSSNNGDVGIFAWGHAPLHYHHVPNALASVNGASNRSSSGYLQPPLPQHHAHHPPLLIQGVRGYNVNLPSQVAASSHQMSGISSSNFRDVVDARSSFFVPIPPMNFQSYMPHQREIALDSRAGHHVLPHLRVLPKDEVAILGFPGYHEAGEIDQHRDMRLDIDHMSYEELLALGEQIGSVGTGLSEEFVRENLKIRSFTLSTDCVNLEDATGVDQQINFCVICQMDYEDGEEIGTVDCGHEYHRECVNKWLLTKNTCPVCKSTALGHKSNDL